MQLLHFFPLFSDKILSALFKVPVHVKLKLTKNYEQKNHQEFYYFPAESLSSKKLKAIVEESKEDYPEDDPLPIYGKAPYDYYGDVMLGGVEYLAAYQAAQAKCQEINDLNFEKN